jgi:lactoylglutathione lyase
MIKMGGRVMILKNNLKGVQHLGIPVANIEKSKKWYCDILGAQVVYETTNPSDEGMTYVAFLELSGLIIEMYQLAGNDLQEVKSRGQGHIDHIAFDVDDVEDVYQKLCKLNIKAIEGSPKFLPFWENGVKFLTISGPDNEKIEFSQKL